MALQIEFRQMQSIFFSVFHITIRTTEADFATSRWENLAESHDILRFLDRSQKRIVYRKHLINLDLGGLALQIEFRQMQSIFFSVYSYITIRTTEADFATSRWENHAESHDILRFLDRSQKRTTEADFATSRWKNHAESHDILRFLDRSQKRYQICSFGQAEEAIEQYVRTPIG
ncbi:hypothetical protein CEXT_59791 [Caerostris extrusa]|uniref:Uncharacterized protein n=1 Tax=Caerostris extrusa TaxID=172846 RepID=A0AAV4XTJ9_CAEEX|nr:hypothetical protein CEXT_59791 [Caerostris extrusa]